MRFLIIVKAKEDSEEGVMPPKEMFEAMAGYHEELADAGLLLEASGLKPSKEAWRMRYSGGRRTLVDGPFAETKELIAGFTLIRANAREEALEWTKRFPNPAPGDGDTEAHFRALERKQEER